MDRKDIVLFANENSGSKKARGYLLLTSPIQVNEHITLHIFSLVKQQSRDEGIRTISYLVHESAQLKVMIAGGDGSLVPLIEQIKIHKIDISRIEFGILPFGTGNDLSAMFGWGRNPKKPIVGKKLIGIKRDVEFWTEATPVEMDIWKVTIELKENGYLTNISKSKKGFVRNKFIDGTEGETFSRLMTNYFSIGLDARIGLGFDKKRSNNKYLNRIRYCWEGLKKMCCLDIPWVHRITSSVYENDSPIYDEDNTISRKTSVLLFLNSRTYAGGNNFIWDRAKGNIGTVQSFSDGLLEVIRFDGKFNLGLEQVIPGRGHKIHQGTGPFNINFKDLDDNRRVYMQIDGEYFYANNPKSVTIELSEISIEKSIKILKK
jgi:diacylglycerol kinase (ATP)